MDQFSSPQLVYQFYTQPVNFNYVHDHNELCKVLNVALVEKVREMELFLNGEKYLEVVERFVQPEYSEVGRRRG